MIRKYLRALLVLCAIALLTAAWLQAKDKGEKFYKQGQLAEQKQDWDKAVQFYEQAVDLAPSNMQYTIAMRRARFQSGQKHVALGQKLRTDGKLEEALAEFQKALIADPSSSIAIQEMRRTQEMIKGAKPGEKAEERGLTPVQQARRDSDDRVASILSPPELKPVVRQVGPLKMNNQPPKVLFETVGKLAGVNVLFDPQYTPQARNFNVELSNGTAEQAFEYLAMLTHTFWKPVSANTIFVSEDNPTKHRDYDDEVVKTFYLTNVTSVQEFQEIATAIRTLTDIRRAFTYNAQKALVVRGTTDAVALAEKLVHDLDKPKSEVIIDVIVMQVNSERTKNLAATITNASGTAGLSMPIAFTPGGVPSATSTATTTTTTTTTTTPVTTTPTTTASTAGGITLGQLPHIGINDFSTLLPNGLLNLLMTDTKTKVLNSPQLRASDGQKATLKIGNRIPYATGSFQPGVGTVGVSPLVSTQFQYADVGVNVEITPQVHSSDEVTLHIDVEVSSVSQYVNLGGISQPVIGQNKNQADVRLRDGEVNILSGLSQMSDASTLNGIPGLTDIPVLGKFLFGNSTTDVAKGELLIALIPHILRTPDYSAQNLRGIYAGSDATVKLMFAPKEDEATDSGAAKPSAATPAAATIPAGATPAASSAAPPAPAAAKPTAPPATAPVPGQARLSFLPAAIQATVSSPVVVTVQVENANDVAAGSPLKIKYDPAQLRLNDITPGEMLSRDGVRVTTVKDIRNDAGEATLTISRLAGSPGISGSGAIATLNFVAVGAGSSTVSLADSAVKNSKQETITVTLGELPVKVQ
jgi:general secretion pathway protein D